MRKLIVKFQKGMSLIEVLIALAVLSIGLVGMAAMNMTTLQYVHSAHYRSLATTIALDIEERLWVELSDNDLEGCPDISTGDGTPVAAMLTHWSREYVGGEGEDDWSWSSMKMLQVPNLAVSVGTPIALTRVVQIPITLSWNDSRFSENESTTESFEYNIRILCRDSGEEVEEEV